MPGGSGTEWGGEEGEWLAEGYRYAWGRLWDARAQEPGDSPEAMAVHSVADRTSRKWGGVLGKLWRFAMGSPGLGKGAVLSGYLLQQARGGEGGGFSLRYAWHHRGCPLGRGHGLDSPHCGPDTPEACQVRRGARVSILPFSPGPAGGSHTGEPEGKPVVALMCLSWFAFLRVAEAASVRAADVRGDKALGFRATKRGKAGRWWRRWSEWSRAWGDFLRDWTKGWDSEAPVVPGGAPVLEAAMASFSEGTEWAEGGWHGHRRGGAAAAWARGPLQAWFLFWGRWDDKATAMGSAKDFQDPRVLEDLLLPWPGKGGALVFRDFSASQVCRSCLRQRPAAQ